MAHEELECDQVRPAREQSEGQSLYALGIGVEPDQAIVLYQCDASNKVQFQY